MSTLEASEYRPLHNIAPVHPAPGQIAAADFVDDTEQLQACNYQDAELEAVMREEWNAYLNQGPEELAEFENYYNTEEFATIMNNEVQEFLEEERRSNNASPSESNHATVCNVNINRPSRNLNDEWCAFMPKAASEKIAAMSYYCDDNDYNEMCDNEVAGILRVEIESNAKRHNDEWHTIAQNLKEDLEEQERDEMDEQYGQNREYSPFVALQEHHHEHTRYLGYGHMYDPARNPNRHMYDHTRDPNLHVYDHTRDPNRHMYDHTRDPNRHMYDHNRDPNRHMYDHNRDRYGHNQDHTRGHNSRKDDHTRGHHSRKDDHIRGHHSRKDDHTRGRKDDHTRDRYGHKQDHTRGHHGHKQDHTRGQHGHKQDHIRGRHGRKDDHTRGCHHDHMQVDGQALSEKLLKHHHYLSTPTKTRGLLSRVGHFLRRTFICGAGRKQTTDD